MARLYQIARAIVALVGCWWLLVTLTPIDYWWASRLANPWGPGTGDVLVVLSGDTLGDGILGASSYLRAVYTVRAIRANHFNKVIITGEPAEAIRQFVAGSGIDTANIVVETGSTSTEQNAERTAPLLREGGAGGRIVLLTSDYHVWRAVRVFRKQGLNVEVWPIPDILKRYGFWQNRAALFIELCQESAKIAWYKWKGWI
jgi:uncharacterized SAM-binding protein YcdF (DUF218 family)